MNAILQLETEVRLSRLALWLQSSAYDLFNRQFPQSPSASLAFVRQETVVAPLLLSDYRETSWHIYKQTKAHGARLALRAAGSIQTGSLSWNSISFWPTTVVTTTVNAHNRQYTVSIMTSCFYSTRLLIVLLAPLSLTFRVAAFQHFLFLKKQ